MTQKGLIMAYHTTTGHQVVNIERKDQPKFAEFSEGKIGLACATRTWGGAGLGMSSDTPCNNIPYSI